MNKPKVMAMNGMLRNTRMGLINKVTIESAAATHTALQKFLISTPFKTLAVIKTDTLFINQAQIII